MSISVQCLALFRAEGGQLGCGVLSLYVANVWCDSGLKVTSWVVESYHYMWPMSGVIQGWRWPVGLWSLITICGQCLVWFRAEGGQLGFGVLSLYVANVWCDSQLKMASWVVKSYHYMWPIPCVIQGWRWPVGFSPTACWPVSRWWPVGSRSPVTRRSAVGSRWPRGGTGPRSAALTPMTLTRWRSSSTPRCRTRASEVSTRKLHLHNRHRLLTRLYGRTWL